MRSRAVTGAVVAVVVLVAAGLASDARAAVLPVGTSVSLAGEGFCATKNATCSFVPAPHARSGGTYLVVAFVHGPGQLAGTVSDSLGDPFHLVSYCWLDNGNFGHTELFLGNATIRSPSDYRLVLSVANRDSGEYLEAALGYAGGVPIRVDGFSNTCANRWTNTTQTVLPTTSAATKVGDLGLYLWVLGEANFTEGPISCASAASRVLTCGTPLSGYGYGLGLSWPSLAYQEFAYSRGGLASIRASGGGFGTAHTPWDVSYVTLTSLS